MSSAEGKKWLVFYTRSRHEKKVAELLAKRGFEVFLPFQKIIRQWSDRKKKVEVPLFNSYIFVKESEDKIVDILQCPGVAWNIRYNNRPAVLHAEELELIKRFIASGLFVQTTESENVAVGDKVSVIDGPLKGLTGTVILTSEGKKFTVLLESIQQNIIISIDPFLLKILS